MTTNEVPTSRLDWQSEGYSKMLGVPFLSSSDLLSGKRYHDLFQGVGEKHESINLPSEAGLQVLSWKKLGLEAAAVPLGGIEAVRNNQKGTAARRLYISHG